MPRTSTIARSGGGFPALPQAPTMADASKLIEERNTPTVSACGAGASCTAAYGCKQDRRSLHTRARAHTRAHTRTRARPYHPVALEPAVPPPPMDAKCQNPAVGM